MADLRGPIGKADLTEDPEFRLSPWCSCYGLTFAYWKEQASATSREGPPFYKARGFRGLVRVGPEVPGLLLPREESSAAPCELGASRGRSRTVGPPGGGAGPCSPHALGLGFPLLGTEDLH